MLSLTHQYTFNNGTANDSVGAANGTLVHGATIVDGWLTLQNISSVASTNSFSNNITSGDATAQYVSLPSGVLPASGSATLEVWYTSSSAMPNSTHVFDFGDAISGAANSYFYYTPRTSSNDARAVMHAPGAAEKVAALTGGTFDGFSHMAAVVVDSAAATLRLYIDGSLITSTALSGTGLSNISNVTAYLGRSLTDADPAFNGGIDELRIYNDAESDTSIATHATQGATRPAPTNPARQVENLDRGVVAFNRASSQVYLSWRLLATDPSDISFNVYRSTNGGAPVKRNSSPITKTTDFTDTGVTQSSTNEYFVRAVINGVEQGDSKHFTIAANTAVNQFLNIPLTPPPGGTVPDVANPGQFLSYTYNANDASVGDLDGDGQYEIILKWDSSLSKDSSQDGFTGNTYFDAYRLDGTRLWRIDLGQNIRAGAHYTQFIVYDLDGDGKAEIVMKTAPGTIDGQGNPVLMGSDHVTDDYRSSTTGRINTGPEYLTVFNGLTGAAMTTVAFKPDRVNTSTWGDDYGNRQDRILMAVAYLDGSRPSLVVGRGIFPGQSSGHAVRNELTAWNFRNGQLSMLWWFKADVNASSFGIPDVNTSYIGQGTYNMHPADVNGDGKDEIMYGEMAVNSNGTPRYSTGLGHGDAMHVSDLDPTRPGEEVFMPEETPSAYGIYGGALRDASSGQPLEAIDGHNADVGRGVAYDLDPRYLGAEMWQSADANIYDMKGDVVQAKPSNMFINFGIEWDADPQYELEDGTTISNWVITNGVGGRSNYVSPSGLSSNNGTKSTPCLTADIFGDWREEVIWRTADNSALQIWSTVIAAKSRMVTFMDDIQYREAIAWQNVGYNQPPHTSFFMGDGMRTPPVPNVNVTPSIVVAASAVPAPVVAKTTTLSVLGADDGGEPNLIYTWAGSGPGSISYSVNGTNAAKNTLVTFGKAGTYTFTVTALDAGGLTAKSSVSVTVNQTLTSITVSPPSGSIYNNNSQQFAATGFDQFGLSMSPQPVFTWTTDAGSVGGVNATGLYTAPANAIGSAVVRATSGSISNTANINVVWLKGDLNGNGQVGTADVSALMFALADLAGYQMQRGLGATDLSTIADVNSDGAIDNRDIQSLIALIANTGGGGGGSGSTSAVTTNTSDAPNSAIVSPAQTAAVDSHAVEIITIDTTASETTTTNPVVSDKAASAAKSTAATMPSFDANAANDVVTFSSAIHSPTNTTKSAPATLSAFDQFFALLNSRRALNRRLHYRHTLRDTADESSTDVSSASNPSAEPFTSV